MGVLGGNLREAQVLDINTGTAVSISHHQRVLDVTAGLGGDVTITVPASGTLPQGFSCVVRRNPASVSNVILGTGISKTLTEAGEGLILIQGPSDWCYYPTMGKQGDPGTPGTDGTDGADGANGADGRTWLNGSGAPSDGSGANGDFYLDTAASAWYGPKAAGTWSGTGPHSMVGAAGADGADGADGANGADGRTWLSGSGAPSDGSGENGDFYLDTAASAWYGPKAAGTWSGTGPHSMVGAAGADGTDGADGVGVPAAGTTGQVLKKKSNSDYDTEWGAAGIGDHAHNGSDAQKLSQANTHESPDTDSATTALHHTLGSGANQAAPGNHSHTLPSHYHSGGDIDSGTVGVAYLPVGTGANNVAAGNHSHAQLHDQNTDTGTTGADFTVDSDSTTGKIKLAAAAGAADKTLTLTNAALTDNRTITLPDATGTAALTTQKLDDFGSPDDNADLNASTSAHGLLLKATAPASGVRNVVAIDNGETAYKNTALFDSTNPAALGTAAPGSSLIAARRDHVHALTSFDMLSTLTAAQVTHTGAGTATIGAWNVVNSATEFTLTLPTASGNSGKCIGIRSVGGGPILIAPYSGETIYSISNLSTTFGFYLTYLNSMILISNGTVWLAVEENRAINYGTTLNLDNSMSIATINSKINALPKHIGQYVGLTLQFADGTYTVDASIAVTGFHGGGYVTLKGNPAEDFYALHTNQAVVLDGSAFNGHVINCNSFVYMQALNLRVKVKTSAAGNIALLLTCPRGAFILGNYFEGNSTSNGYGFYAQYGSTITFNYNYVSNVNVGVMCYNCRGFCYNNDDTGTAPAYGIDSDASFLAISGTYPNGTTKPLYSTNGGVFGPGGLAYDETFNSDDTWYAIDCQGATADALVLVEAWGGGGSGGRSAAGNGAGGGGGGAYACRWFKLSELGASQAITIGLGGVAAAGTGVGNAGGLTSFGSLLYAYGGGGGYGNAAAQGYGGGGGGAMWVGSNGSASAGGIGGTPGGGQTNGAGDGGSGGGAGGATASGAGGGAMFGGGGGGGGQDGATTAGAGGASYFGGGGGGGASDTGTGGAGGATVAGGAGGAGGSNGGAPGAGTAPGGGGGGAENQASGAGGKGRVRVRVWA